MNRNKGSISIFLIILLPIITIGFLSAFIHLRRLYSENEMIKSVQNASEIQLDLSNRYLFDNYGILAYSDQSLIALMMGDKVSSDTQLSVISDPLASPETYMRALDQAGKALIGKSVVSHLEALISQSIDLSAATDLLDVLKKVETGLKTINDLREIHSAFKALESYGITRQGLMNVLDLIEMKVSQNMDLYDSFKVNLSLESVQTIQGAVNQLEIAHQASMSFLNGLLNKTNDLLRLGGEITSHTHLIIQLKEELAQLELQENTEEIELKKAEIEMEKESLAILKEERDALIGQVVEETANKKPTLLLSLSLLNDQLDAIKQTLVVIDPKTIENYDYDWQVTSQDIFLNRFYINEYFLAVFKSFDLGTSRNFDPLKSKSTRPSVLEGEVEFLIVGCQSDKENMRAIRTRIFSIRSIANLVHILNSPHKIGEINALTSAISPPWGTLTKSALLTLWSGAEAYLDLVALEAGKGSYFIKTDSEWTLDLKQLLKGDWSEKSKVTYLGIQDPKLYYQDYLRILLLATNEKKVLNRSMTLLNENLLSVSQGRFELKDFMTGHRVKVQWKDAEYEFVDFY